MRCPNCNCDVPEGSLFCPECGQKLEGVNGSQAENSGETYNDQQQDAEDVYGDQQRNKEDTYNDRSEDTEDSLWDQPQNSSDIYGTSPRNYGNPYGNQSQNQGGFYGNPSQNQNFGGSYGNQSQNFGGPYPGQQNGGNTYWRQPQSQNNGPERMAAGNHFDNSMQGVPRVSQVIHQQHTSCNFTLGRCDETCNIKMPLHRPSLCAIGTR